MKRPSWWTGFIIVFFLLVSFLLAKSLVVQIKTTHLRTEAQFYAQTIAVLNSGDTVEQLETKNGWIKVKSSKGAVGWVHSSAVKPKRFALLSMAGDLQTKASSDEVALAGKGFNKQVEGEYKVRNPGLNFALVDKILKIHISPSEIKDFLKKGQLGEFRGEQ
ncbi:MAG: SH3 domain-containing protein [Candidatus Aminicenantes bacterium]|nr:SH3 domain-containing protein [Candidatus Aminicenantes bacterium]